MNANGVFITGTGTDVGKTVISTLLLSGLLNAGINAAPMKPIQTGATVIDGELSCPDLDYCLQQTGLVINAEDYKLMGPYRYEPACSPHLAGRLAGSYPELNKICNAFDTLTSKYEFIVAEGAGGIMVPVTETESTLNLVQCLKIPVIITASLGLGTINHSLLTIDVLKRNSIPMVGIIFTQTIPGKINQEFIYQDNPEIVTSLGGIPLLGVLPFIDDFSNSKLKQILDTYCPGLVRYIRGLK